MATVQRGHVPAGRTITPQRRDPVLDTRAGRVWRDDFVCRKFRGGNPDHATGDLSGVREEPWGGSGAFCGAGGGLGTVVGSNEETGKDRVLE